MNKYETVVGLEIHTELSTNSKIFCRCPVLFGEKPNTLCCPVCTGMPGTLPVLNGKVLEYAVLTGLALDCDISEKFRFDRKNYFYPDLPKAYQISQLYIPICKNGKVEIDLPGNKTKTVRIREIHMEEDAGKLIHDPWKDKTLVDYNRAGVPLLEIVSEPDIRNADEAVEYILKLKSVLQYLGVSDCKMQEGSLRADINISVRAIGENTFGTRTEMKNLNSLKSVSRAIQEESKRQISLLEEGNKIIQETRRWDENKDMSYPMRGKEDAQDYRYFPDPDLPVFSVSKQIIDSLKQKLPEMMSEKKERYESEYRLPKLDIQILTSCIKTAVLFEKTLEEGCDPKEVSNYIMGDVMRSLKEAGKEADDLDLSSRNLAKVIGMVKEGKINKNAAGKTITAMVKRGVDPDSYVREESLEQISDDSGIKKIAEKVIKENQGAVQDYRSGKEKAFAFLMGQIMKETRGRASPAVVKEILENELKK